MSLTINEDELKSILAEVQSDLDKSLAEAQNLAKADPAKLLLPPKSLRLVPRRFLKARLHLRVLLLPKVVPRLVDLRWTLRLLPRLPLRLPPLRWLTRQLLRVLLPPASQAVRTWSRSFRLFRMTN